MSLIVEEKHPLKQGLKQTLIQPCRGLIFVEEKHPLKQGLKRYSAFITCHISYCVEEKHPLKQGLKRDYC